MLTKSLRLAASVLLAGATLIVAARPVLADPIDPVYCDQNPVPGCVVRVETPGRQGGSGQPGDDIGVSVCHDPGGVVVPCYIDGRGSLGSDGCYYQPFDNGPPPAGSDGTGSWYVRSCLDAAMNGPLGVPLGGDLVWLPDADVPVSPEALAQRAVSRLELPSPVIRVNPLVMVTPGAPPAQVVYVPTWLWVNSGSWRERSATASAGGLSVTATAEPTQVKWSTGDGATEVCHGPGTPWKPGTDPSKQSPTCGHTYTVASRPTYALGATVTWDITWSGGGESGTLPALTTTAETTLRVVESSALNTRS
jgi:hypothetical protein